MDYPVKRKDALDAGLTHYMNNKPCPRGHIAIRYAKTGQCVVCVRDHSIKWKDDNKDWFPEHTRLYAKKRAKFLGPVLLEKCREWRRLNPDKQKQACRNWNKKNPESRRLHQNLRRARERGAEGKHTIKEIRQMLSDQNYQCVYCLTNIKDKYHIDHIVPLSKGGGNSIDNIQILCVDCNQSKHNKDHETFLKQLTKGA